MIRRPSLAIAACWSLLTAALLLGPPPAAADEADEKDASALRAGAWALQFGIADNFQLATFSGSMISLKHHTSDRSAWRLGVSSSLSGRGVDETTDWVLPDTTFVRTTDTEFHNLTVSLTRLRYPNPGRRVNAYYGAGPYVSIAGDSDEQVLLGETRIRESDRWAVGLNFLFGGEWFPARSLSVHAEYRAAFDYAKETRKETPPRLSGAPTTRTELSTWSFQGNGVRFGASWYF